MKEKLDCLLNENDYDIRLRPQYAVEPVQVGVNIEVTSIDRISEVDMDYTLTVDLEQVWTDKRLALKGEISNLSLDSRAISQIWVPDTYFVNDKKSYIHSITRDNKQLQISTDGKILYKLRVTTDIACQMDLKRYPMDTQKCELKIESYGYKMEDLAYYILKPNMSTKELTLPQFTISDHKVELQNITFHTGNYSRFCVSFQFKRNLGFFLLQTYIPCALITVLSWVSFWIDFQATAARISLGITTVLTITTISTNVRQSLPKIPDIKAIDVYLIICFVFIFLGLVEYTMVNFFHQRNAANAAEKSLIKSLKVVLRDEQAAKKANYTAKFREDDIDKTEEKIRSFDKDDIWNDRKRSRSRNKKDSYRNRQASYQTQISLHQNDKRKMNSFTVSGVNRTPNTVKSRLRQLNKMIRLPQKVDISSIDRYSRFIFPLSFFVFNCYYWTYYTFLSSSD